MGRDCAVAVIGGGIVGTSVLYHLAERGETDVVLLEQDQLGSGSTSGAVGGVRHVFSHPANVDAGEWNLRFYREFEERVGQPLTVDESGYVYLFASGAERDHWERQKELYDDRGLDTRLLTPAETGGLFGPLDTSDIVGSFHAPDCLHLDPYTATQGFATAARERGATVRTGTTVEDVTVEDGAVDAVVTDGETYEPDRVVNAAGGWAPEVGAMVGLDLPIDRFVRRILVTEEMAAGPTPLFIDRERQCYFRAERNGGVVLCDTGNDVEDVTSPAHAGGSPGHDYYVSALSKVETHVPDVVDAEVINDWAGVQTSTPDGHPLLGETGVDGFSLACGFNGLGVMVAPTVGRALADALLGLGEPSDVLDIGRLGLDRFDRPPSDRIEAEELA